METRKKVVLYDSTCPVCVQAKNYAKKRNVTDTLSFISTSSDAGRALAAQHSLDTSTSAYVIDGDTIHAQADAIRTTLKELGGVHHTVSTLLGVLPKNMRDALYRIIASHRKHP